MYKFLPRVQTVFILVLMCFLTLSTDVFAQKFSTPNSKNNDIDNEPLFGQSMVNYGQQPEVVHSYSNTNTFSSMRRKRKVTLDNCAGVAGCEIDDPIDSHILLLIAFALMFSFYILKKTSFKIIENQNYL